MSRNELVAAALFTLAVNHKQVSLYLENFVHLAIRKLCYHEYEVKLPWELSVFLNPRLSDKATLHK